MVASGSLLGGCVNKFFQSMCVYAVTMRMHV